MPETSVTEINDIVGKGPDVNERQTFAVPVAPEFSATGVAKGVLAERNGARMQALAQYEISGKPEALAAGQAAADRADAEYELMKADTPEAAKAAADKVATPDTFAAAAEFANKVPGTVDQFPVVAAGVAANEAVAPAPIEAGPAAQ